MTTDTPPIRDEEIPTRGYRYLVFYGGGIGPDVWDAEREVYAVDIKDALAQCGDITDDGAWIISVEQSDYSKTTTKDQLAKAEADLIRLSAAMPKAIGGILIPQHPPPHVIGALRNFVEEVEKYDTEGVWPDNVTIRRLADEGREALSCTGEKRDNAEIPDAIINNCAFWCDNRHVVDYEVAFDIEKDLRNRLIRLSAEREKEREELKENLPSYTDSVISQRDEAHRELAKRDKELAEVKARITKLEAALLDAEQESDDLESDKDELTAQLLAAQAVNGKLREALERIEEFGRGNETWGASRESKIAAEALDLSPDTTLLDEVVRVLGMAYSREMDWDMLGRAHGNSTVQMWRRAAIDLLSRLRKSTRETEQ